MGLIDQILTVYSLVQRLSQSASRKNRGEQCYNGGPFEERSSFLVYTAWVGASRSDLNALCAKL